MSKKYLLVLTFLAVSLFGAQSVSGQITITIPKLPKIKKDKPTPTPTPTQSSNDDDEDRTNNQSDNNRSNDSGDTDKEQDECATNPVARLVVDELAKMRADIDGFTADRSYFYSFIPTYNYLLFSVSPAARQKWQTDFKTIGYCPKITAGLDALGVSAAKKLPLRLPDKTDYPVHNVAEEKLMKGKINNLADHKIHYIGIKEANWLIDKNDLGIPTARYKHGMVWVRYVPNDHPYCRVYYINIIQDYAGGGTYAASYANFIEETLVGCPAGAK